LTASFAGTPDSISKQLGLEVDPRLRGAIDQLNFQAQRREAYEHGDIGQIFLYELYDVSKMLFEEVLPQVVVGVALEVVTAGVLPALGAVAKAAEVAATAARVAETTSTVARTAEAASTVGRGLEASEAWAEEGAKFTYQYKYLDAAGNKLSNWWRPGKLVFGNSAIEILDTNASVEVLERYTVHEEFHEAVFNFSPQLSHMKTIPIAGGFFRYAEEVAAYGTEAIKTGNYGDLLWVPKRAWNSTLRELKPSQGWTMGAAGMVGVGYGWSKFSP
jgi:hypothetical protein